MESGLTQGWSDFFVATVGATAALAGLVFVSLSINLARIIELPGVSARAGETMALLTGALAASLVMIVPGLSARMLGGLLLLIAAPVWLVPVMGQLRAWRGRAFVTRRLAATRSLLFQLAALPAVVAALALLGGYPHAVGWLAFGVIMSIIVAISNAWVLLVEIMR